MARNSLRQRYCSSSELAAATAGSCQTNSNVSSVWMEQNWKNKSHGYLFLLKNRLWFRYIAAVVPTSMKLDPFSCEQGIPEMATSHPGAANCPLPTVLTRRHLKIVHQLAFLLKGDNRNMHIQTHPICSPPAQLASFKTSCGFAKRDRKSVV